MSNYKVYVSKDELETSQYENLNTTNKSIVGAINEINQKQGSASSTPDWNQNNEAANDYVKNRPFYTANPVETVVFEGTLLKENFSDYSGVYCHISFRADLLIEGTSYNVTINDETTSVVAKKVDGVTYLGNYHVNDSSYEDTGESFCIYDGYFVSSVTSLDNLLDSYTVKVVGYISENVQLDRKYIKSVPGKDVSYETFTVDETEVMAGNNAEIFNDYENNIATGKYSHAEGIKTLASAYASHAEGCQTIASGEESHAEGFQTLASAHVSHAEGFSSNASGAYSHAEGNHTKATGIASHAEGIKTLASTDASHAEGYQTNATNKYSHSEGGYSTASGQYSHAEGLRTNATGNIAHAEGSYTTASGNKSHAEGYYSVAKGEDSHAEGNSTIATAQASHVEGRYNIEDTAGEYLHIAGNGTPSSVRSNAHTLDWSGNAWFAGDVYTGGTGQDDTENVKKLATEDYINENAEIIPIDKLADYGATVDVTEGVGTKTYRNYVIYLNSNMSNPINKIFKIDMPDDKETSGYMIKFASANGTTSAGIYYETNRIRAAYLMIHKVDSTNSFQIINLVTGTIVEIEYDTDGNLVNNWTTKSTNAENVLTHLNKKAKSDSYVPSLDTDVATKKYVDDNATSLSKFVFNISTEDDITFTADKTFAEIQEAYNAGKDIIAVWSIEGTEYNFTLQKFWADEEICFVLWPNHSGMMMHFYIKPDNTIEWFYDNMLEDHRYIGFTTASKQIVPAINEVNAKVNGLSTLPTVTEADNGKILQVVNGQWALVDPSTLITDDGNGNVTLGGNTALNGNEVEY